MRSAKEIIKENIDSLDKRGSYAVYSYGQKFFPKLKPALLALEWSANGLIWLSGTIILLLFNHDASIYSKLFIGLIMDVVYIAIAKSFARRRRPLYAYQRDQIIVASVDKYSMPSGHCSRVTYLSYFMASFFGSSSILSLFITFWAICVCVSRVLLGRHHILDCLAGILLGWLEYQIQFNTLIPINAFGTFLVRQVFGNKSFSDRNDLDGTDPLD